MPKALTNIKHDDQWIAAGDEVTGLPDDVMDSLAETGALDLSAEEQAAVDERVADREAQVRREAAADASQAEADRLAAEAEAADAAAEAAKEAADSAAQEAGEGQAPDEEPG